MLDADYVQAHLTAAWRIMVTAKGDALARMDITAEGFWRSFWSILLALPPMLLSWVAAAPDFLAGDGSLSLTVLRLGIADLAAWIVPIAGLGAVSGAVGMRRSFAAYVIATNWGSAILVWLAVPPALVRLLASGEPDPSGFLSLMTGYSAADFLIAGRTRILLQPVGGRLRSLNGWADVDPSGDNGASPLPIHAAGLGPCRVIQGSGGVFIAAKGYEAQAEHHFPAPGQTETGRTPKLRTRNWGAEQLVEEDYGIKIMRLEVDPGGVLPPECHFRRRETWSVSSGQAIAKIDQRIVKLLPGDHVTLEPGMIHSLRNAANEVLVLYETRIGSYLEDDDRVRIQPPAAGRSSAAGP